MSKINTLRVADDIKSQTTIYTPVIEAIVNSIQAISSSDNKTKGFIDIYFERNNQQSLDAVSSKSNFNGIEVIDNGIGFNKENYDSFDTYRSDYKIELGGKGFGRFMYIKYFDKVSVSSTFEESGELKDVSFDFGKKDSIVENRKTKSSSEKETGSSIKLDGVRGSHALPKELDTIAKVILEKLLVYFISYENLPKIRLIERSTKKEVVLNKFLEDSSEIKEIKSDSFQLKESNSLADFQVRIFKIYSPNNQKSKIILTAHSREVLYTNLMDYIPEFENEFVDSIQGSGESKVDRNYIVKAYVLGDYLNEEVVPERNNFNFEKEKDLFHAFSRKEIEQKGVDIVEKELAGKLASRLEKKQKKVEKFLENSPYYREYEKDIDWNSLSMNPTNDQIELEFHKVKYENVKDAKVRINAYLEGFDKGVENKIEEIFADIHKGKRSDLAEYITLRRVFLNILKKSLEISDDKKTHRREDIVHSIIFPTKQDSINTKFKDHNLWILDERLSFEDYLRSDMKLSEEHADRPDIISFDRRIAYRGENEASNPITIFEFKKPGIDDFALPGSKEDPEEQITRYIDKIKSKEVFSYTNREILVADNTPFIGYIVADITKNTEKWLNLKGFTALPNNQRWFSNNPNFNLRLEFISWDQLVKEAEQRNNTFFHYLGI